MRVVALLIATASLLQLLVPVSCGDKPSCKVILMFKVACAEPHAALLKQVQGWGGKKCRDRQEKCMYQVENDAPTSLQVTHTSPNTQKVNALSFLFNPVTAVSFCKVTATSNTKSENGTQPNDYCLIHNLVEGARLNRMNGFREVVNSAMCPPKHSSNCHHH